MRGRAKFLRGQSARSGYGHGYAPTFSAISGIKLPADLKLQPDGHNIENLIMGGPEEKTPYKTFYYSNNSGVRSGPWKYRAGRKYGNWAFPRGEMPKDNPQEKQLFT